MQLEQLTRPEGPWLHLLVATPSDAWDELRALEQAARVRLAARVIRGRKAATVADFFDEASAALQFPYYFGENWDAFRDCLSDLSWLEADAVVVFIADAAHLLEQASAAEVQSFVTVVRDAVQRWSEAGRPFHVVFQSAPKDEAAVKKHWQAAHLTLHGLA
jgi:RNAse (barnase) inhibitor barstar